MSSVRVIIVEDEPAIQDLIIIMVKRHFPEAIILSVQSSVSSAINAINNDKPDLVFLDIEINEGTGFDILNAYESRTFEVIFVTGYDQYMIDAIRSSALDYLMKPIIEDEFSQAVSRYKKALNQHSKYIILEGAHTRNKVLVDDIVYIEISKHYIKFILADDKYFVSSKLIGDYSSHFPEYIQMSHRNYWVNLNFIKSIDSGRGGYIYLQNGNKIPVSYRRKNKLYNEWIEILS